MDSLEFDMSVGPQVCMQEGSASPFLQLHLFTIVGGVLVAGNVSAISDICERPLAPTKSHRCHRNSGGEYGLVFWRLFVHRKAGKISRCAVFFNLIFVIKVNVDASLRQVMSALLTD